jgi:hypothetical protein
MKDATLGSTAQWTQRPAGVSQIRRCRATGGMANEYCELTAPQLDDAHGAGGTDAQSDRVVGSSSSALISGRSADSL